MTASATGTNTKTIHQELAVLYWGQLTNDSHSHSRVVSAANESIVAAPSEIGQRTYHEACQLIWIYLCHARLVDVLSHLAVQPSKLQSLEQLLDFRLGLLAVGLLTIRNGFQGGPNG
jgi:hypothetical protein